MQGVRNVLSASQLGRASISALTDTQNARITARMIGLPQVSMMTNYFKTVFAGLSSRERAKLAARLGGGADNWIDTAILTARFNGEKRGLVLDGQGARVSDFVMRGSSGLALGSGCIAFKLLHSITECLSRFGKNKCKTLKILQTRGREFDQAEAERISQERRNNAFTLMQEIGGAMASTGSIDEGLALGSNIASKRISEERLAKELAEDELKKKLAEEDKLSDKTWGDVTERYKEASRSLGKQKKS